MSGSILRERSQYIFSNSAVPYTRPDRRHHGYNTSTGMLTSQMLFLHVSVTFFLPLPGNAYGAFANMNNTRRVFVNCIKVLTSSLGNLEEVSAGMRCEAGNTGCILPVRIDEYTRGKKERMRTKSADERCRYFSHDTRTSISSTSARKFY